MRTLSPRERKLVAVGLLLLVVALAWLAVIDPIVSGFGERAERREELRAAYQRNSRLINAVPALRRRAERQEAESGRFLLRAPNPAAARIALGERLRQTFAANGGEVSAVQDVAQRGDRLGAWVGGRISLDGLERTLQALGATPPYLVIESLRVSADRALESGHLDILDVRIEASVAYLAAAA